MPVTAASTLAVASIVLVGCSTGSTTVESPIGSAVDGAEADAGTGPSEAVAPSAAAALVDPTTVPEALTPAYAEAVYATNISAFARVLDAVLHPDAGEEPEDGGVAVVSSIARGDAREQLLATLDRARADGGGDRFVGDSYVGPRLTDTTLLYAGADCLIVAARLDFTGSGAVGEVTDALTAFSFVRSDPGASTPTAWLLTKQLANEGADGPNDDEVLLGATLADFGALLDHDCEEADDAR